MKNTTCDIKVIHANSDNIDEILNKITGAIGDGVREEIERRKKREQMATEMALVTTRFHMDIVKLSNKYGEDPKHMAFCALSALSVDLENWDESCNTITEQDEKAYEELKNHVFEAAE